LVGVNKAVEIQTRHRSGVALYKRSIAELWSNTCHMGSHSVHGHPTGERALP